MTTRRSSDTILSLLALTLLLLTGCSGVATPSPVAPAAVTPEATEPPTSTPVPSPTAGITVPPPREDGLASIGGVLYTYYGQAPIPGTVFYLTPAAGEQEDRPPSVLSGAHADQGDVRGTSDEGGRFVLDAVAPGKYFLVVWAPYNWIVAEESETDDTPRLIEVEAGQRLDLGRVDVPWP